MPGLRSALASMRLTSVSGLMERLMAHNRATTPATCGAAIDVPLAVPYRAPVLMSGLKVVPIVTRRRQCGAPYEGRPDVMLVYGGDGNHTLAARGRGRLVEPRVPGGGDHDHAFGAGVGDRRLHADRAGNVGAQAEVGYPRAVIGGPLQRVVDIARKAMPGVVEDFGIHQPRTRRHRRTPMPLLVSAAMTPATSVP